MGRDSGCSDPFFSIILPTYDRARFLPTALRSVFEQTFQDFEIVVVDDASADETQTVLASYKDPRLVTCRNTRNLHKGGARNRGISLARGRYVCFLDDDDYYLSCHLSVFHHEIVSRGFPVGLFFTMCASQELGRCEIHIRPLSPIGKMHPVAYLFHPDRPVGAPQACVHTSILHEQRFNEKIRIGQDTELFMRIAAKYQVFPIEAVTFVGVRHTGASGHVSRNAGRERLEGLRYVFANAELRKHIGWRLRLEMYAYCYHRIALYHQQISQRWATCVALLISVACAPWYGRLIPKLVMLVYSLPGGGVVRAIVRAAKRLKGRLRG